MKNHVKKNEFILLITHTLHTGPSQELQNYLINNKYCFTFIEHPFPYNNRQDRSRATLYEKGRIQKYISGLKIKGPDTFCYLKDFVQTITLVLFIGKKYNICIASNNLNALASLLLKKIGYIKKVIYWSIDYSPKRFENRVLNYVYHLIDKFCYYHADLIWCSSTRMKSARKLNGVNVDKYKKELIVQDGCHFETIKRLPEDQANPFKLVFMGHLIENKGVDLIIETLPRILKDFPKVTLTLIGEGPEFNKLKNLVKNLDIENKVLFTGFVKNHIDVEKKIASCGIGIAPYVPNSNNLSFYSDVGKIKIYLACGLPTLSTNVPEIAQELEEKEAGYIFDYNQQSLSGKIRLLLQNKDRYLAYRRNAIKLASSLDWDNVFNRALSKTI